LNRNFSSVCAAYKFYLKKLKKSELEKIFPKKTELPEWIGWNFMVESGTTHG
jgi:hypothetical protein